MTSPNTGVRRTALAVLAVGAALGLAACGSGQISQTANQVPAVDGGQGRSGDLTVNDIRVVLPEGGQGQAKVGMVASYTGNGLGTDRGVRVTRIEVGGVQASVQAPDEIGRGCSMVFPVEEHGGRTRAGEGACLKYGTATLSSSDALRIGNSVPTSVHFSNGTTVEVRAGVVAAPVVSGEYTRDEGSHAENAGH